MKKWDVFKKTYAFVGLYYANGSNKYTKSVGLLNTLNVEMLQYSLEVGYPEQAKQKKVRF